MSSKQNGKRNNKQKRARRERADWREVKRPLAPGHYLPIDPRLTDIECPDCAARWSAPDRQRNAGPGGALEHAPTCPIGKGYAQASDDDRAWFDANPGTTERVRPPTLAELQAVALATGQALPDMPNGGRLEPGGVVVVTKVSEHLRQRDFSAAVLLVQPALSPADGYHPDEFDETGQLWFREHIGPSRLADEANADEDGMQSR